MCIRDRLETITPPADQIYADAGQPIGYIVTESAHIGYKARLWKITMEKDVYKRQQWPSQHGSGHAH